MGQVVAPGSSQTRQRQLVLRRVCGAVLHVEQVTYRALPVHRRPYAAGGGEARGLGDRDVGLGWLDLQVGVGGLLLADGRIDVEAVDLSSGHRWWSPLAMASSVWQHGHRGEIARTRVGGSAWPAQPNRLARRGGGAGRGAPPSARTGRRR